MPESTRASEHLEPPTVGARASRWRGLEVQTEGTGISEPLSDQVNLLGILLGRVIREHAGSEMLDLVEKLRLLCREAAHDGRPAARDEAASVIATLEHDQILWLLRSFTAFFHLVNQAEQQEIIRINRERARHSNPEHPRPESINEAIHALWKQGLTLDEVVALLRALDVQPTLTAHPTEARRRSILYKQQRISARLAQMNQGTPTPDEDAQALDDIHNQIALLLTTDEVRATRPTVEDEVEQGLYFMRNAIWETIPKIYRDLRDALQTYYEDVPELPTILRYRSWIGSDRDGNPYVTADVTRQTVRLQRRTALELFLGELRTLRRELSISDRQVPVPKALRESLAHEASTWQLDGGPTRQYRHEPYRLKLSYMMARIEQLLRETRHGSAPLERPSGAAYSSARFVDDLQLLRRCLKETGYHDVADTGHLGQVLVLAQTFGFHMASLDVRQHSRVHEETVAVLLRLAGVHDDYAALGEDEKLALLGAELANPRPLLPRGAALPDEARRVMETFDVIRNAIEQEPRIIGSYIISMTHAVSDMLEVLLLAKEAGLWQMRQGAVASPLDVVPLFETIEDLHDAERLLDALFTHPIYRRHLAARDDFQEIMLGYSDSNKDGGYWMANWALHQAQDRIGQTCQRHSVDFRLFHGRGGTVGRGGGRANQAILAMPSVVHNGRIRFTEQGEVISFRYALPGIARRHLEQIVNAMIRSTAQARQERDSSAPSPEDGRLMDAVAEAAMAAYRSLIDDDDLWTWYTQVTPIEQISRLPIASRPISRTSTREVDFEGLRAIPWVFAWTQTRYIVPGWYGIGHGLQSIVEGDAGHMQRLQRLYQSWRFFRAVVNNAQREMARARFEIAAYYAGLADPDAPRNYHEVIAEDFALARRAILQITGQNELLGNSPVIRKSISLRNPYTDVLNLLQVELIRRFRRTPEEEREPLRQALFLSINGLAAAMQSTG